MAIWQIVVLFALAASAIGCLWGICKAIERLSSAVFSIRIELTKINAKLEAIEVNEFDRSFETAIRDIENLAKPLE